MYLSPLSSCPPKTQSIENLIFPVLVIISHLPPLVVFGTLILPVAVSVMNTLSLSRLPETFPVSVSMLSSAASHPFNSTLPVLLRMEHISVVSTVCKEIFPVLPLEDRFLQVILVIIVFPVDTLTAILLLQFTLVAVILPVEVERFIVSAEIFSTLIWPVLKETATSLKCKLSSSSTLPVLPLTRREEYSVFGR